MSTTQPAHDPPGPCKLRIHIPEQPSADDFAAIFHCLDASTTAIIGPASLRPLVLLLRGPDGRTIGGLWARTIYAWLTIEMLFVPESLRGRGVGSRLVAMAETAAMHEGCIAAQVSTFDFQAPGFYRRLGYQEFAALPDMPPGHSTCFFAKRLVPGQAASSASSSGIA